MTAHLVVRDWILFVFRFVLGVSKVWSSGVCWNEVVVAGRVIPGIEAQCSSSSSRRRKRVRDRKRVLELCI
jgi:hypothetical protein